MIDTFAGNGGVALCLCQNKCALQNGLCVEREAARRPVGADAVTFDGFGDIGFDSSPRGR